MTKKKIKKNNQRKKPQLVAKGKKVLKKMVRKKPKRIQKKTTKKTVKFLHLKKSIPPKKTIISPTEPTPLAQTNEHFVKKVDKTISQNISSPNSKKNYISKHILDLRQIQVENSDLQAKREKDVYGITEEFFKKLTPKKTQNHLKTITAEKTSNKERQIESAISSHSVKESWPKKKMDWPKFNIPQIKFPQSKIILPLTWVKTTISFIMVCSILVSPLLAFEQYEKLIDKKTTVLGKAAAALAHLSISGEAASARDLYYTQFELQAANENFSDAENELANINLIIQNLIKITPRIGKQYSSATKILNAGEKLSRSAVTLSTALNNFNFTKKSEDEFNLADKLSSLKDCLNLILPDLKIAEDNLSAVNIDEIPNNYQDKIIMLRTMLPELENNIYQFIEYSKLALQIMGQDGLKRYLILFQNSNELRPTGGFIGSYALMDFDRGNIKKISIPGGGPYDLKAGLTINISAPRPLRILNQRWEFQDANWFADLPASAEKLKWFYEKSGGPTVDGLIFINASFVEKILKITGPIEMPDYGKSINSENFINEVQNSVEFEYDKKLNKPKQIIADLAPKLINKLISADGTTLVKILDEIFNALNEKEIQLYFTNYSLEKFVLNNNWGGQIKTTDKDYLNIVSTNIAGEKTDANITQEANLNVNIKEDGTVINTLTLTKTHAGKLNQALYGVPNVDYLRIFTPKGSEFISASGFDIMEDELFENIDPEIYQTDEELASISNTKRVEPITQTEIYYEGDKTVFANWLKVDAGQTKTISLSYKLPFKINLKSAADSKNENLLELIKSQIGDDKISQDFDWYSLLLQKQSGRNTKVRVSVNFPDSFEIIKLYPDDLVNHDDSYVFDDILNTDKILAIIFKKK